jgi:hypothetical protein
MPPRVWVEEDTFADLAWVKMPGRTRPPEGPKEDGRSYATPRRQRPEATARPRISGTEDCVDDLGNYGTILPETRSSRAMLPSATSMAKCPVPAEVTMSSVPDKTSRPSDKSVEHSNSSDPSRPDPAQPTPGVPDPMFRGSAGTPDTSEGSQLPDSHEGNAGDPSHTDVAGQVGEHRLEQTRARNRVLADLLGAQVSGDVNPLRLPGDLFVNPTPSSAETERLAKDLLDRTRAETTQAENKAAILLAGILAAAGGIAAADGGKWIPAHRPWYITVPIWAAVAAALAAIACLAAAVYPRSRAQENKELTLIGYFGDVTALGSPNELRSLLSESGTKLLDVWIDQIWQTSAIVSRKYRFVRWSVRLLGVALALAVVSIIVATIRSR